MVSCAGLGQIVDNFFVSGILTTLPFNVLSVDPEQPRWDCRGRFIAPRHNVGTLKSCSFSAMGYHAPETPPPRSVLAASLDELMVVRQALTRGRPAASISPTGF